MQKNTRKNNNWAIAFRKLSRNPHRTTKFIKHRYIWGFQVPCRTTPCYIGHGTENLSKTTSFDCSMFEKHFELVFEAAQRSSRDLFYFVAIIFFNFWDLLKQNWRIFHAWNQFVMYFRYSTYSVGWFAMSLLSRTDEKMSSVWICRWQIDISECIVFSIHVFCR